MRSLSLSMITLFWSVLLCATVSAQTSLTNDGLSPQASSVAANDSLSANIVPEDEFLKVEEAYILSITKQNETLNFHWDIVPEYYLYRDRFNIKAFGEEGEVPLNLTYEKGKIKYDENFEMDMEVFYNSVDVQGVPDIQTGKLQLQVISQGCADAGLCYPPYRQYFEIDMADGSTTPIERITAKTNSNTGTTNDFAASSDTSGADTPFLGYILLLAVLGGLILNAMPCVFPVLSIKAVSFVSSQGDGHAHHVHGWAYTAGAVVSFLIIGGVIVGIRAAGGDADWGRQLQSPLIVSLLFYLFLLMGLSLAGFVHFGTSLMGAGQSLTTRSGLQGSFFTGVLAVVVASPCTAPFMAPALGVALTQSAFVALAIFAALGFGMALPFLLLSYSPKLASLLPNPGPWMETFKQVLSFPLYLTAIWLIWVLAQLTNIDATALVLCGAVGLVFAIWLWQKQKKSDAGQLFRRITGAVAVLLALSVAVKSGNLFGEDEWLTYSPQLVSDLRSEGKPVFINLTAAWCITCKANERVALNRENVLQAAENLDVAMIKGDYTNEDPQIHALLNQYKRPSVPLYLMFPADPSQPPEILPQLLTQSIVIEAMERAAGKKVIAKN